MHLPIHAVIFDLDGTLFDHRGSAEYALTHWLPQLGVTPDESTFGLWFAAEERHYPDWVAGDVSLDESRRRRLKEFLPTVGIRREEDETLDGLFSNYLTFYRQGWHRFDDVDIAVSKLTEAGIEMAVLTNGSTQQQNSKIDAIGLGGRLGPVFTSESLGVGKPAPSTYLSVCRHLDVFPGRAVHVGDRYDLDVLAPRSAGLQAIYLDRGGVAPHDEPDRIERLDQLDLW